MVAARLDVFWFYLLSILAKLISKLASNPTSGKENVSGTSTMVIFAIGGIAIAVATIATKPEAKYHMCFYHYH